MKKVNLNYTKLKHKQFPYTAIVYMSARATEKSISMKLLYYFCNRNESFTVLKADSQANLKIEHFFKTFLKSMPCVKRNWLTNRSSGDVLSQQFIIDIYLCSHATCPFPSLIKAYTHSVTVMLECQFYTI